MIIKQSEVATLKQAQQNKIETDINCTTAAAQTASTSAVFAFLLQFDWI